MPAIGADEVTIFAERVLLREGFAPASVSVAGGRIGRVERGRAAGAVRLPVDAILAPGLIDAQVNGGGGVLFNDLPTAGALRTMVSAHRAGGTTGLLPTLITDEPGRIAAASAAVCTARMVPGSGVLGLHLEGPFISPARPGVHDPRWIRTPTSGDLEELAALARDERLGVLLVTLAPERVQLECLRMLAQAGVILSAGHTQAGGRDQAVRGYTHLWNAMPPIAGRAPGPVAACLSDEEAWCGLIADGIHVDPVNLALTLRCKPGRVFLVSDSMAVAGTDMSGFVLKDRPIRRADGRLTTEDGVLAGADLSMIEAVRNAMALAGATLEDGLRMASAAPAEFLRLSDRGRIEVGTWADLVILSSGLDVLGTAIEGVWQSTVAGLRA